MLSLLTKNQTKKLQNLIFFLCFSSFAHLYFYFLIGIPPKIESVFYTCLHIPYGRSHITVIYGSTIDLWAIQTLVFVNQNSIRYEFHLKSNQTLLGYAQNICCIIALAYFFQAGQNINQRFCSLSGVYSFLLIVCRIPSHTIECRAGVYMQSLVQPPHVH